MLHVQSPFHVLRVGRSVRRLASRSHRWAAQRLACCVLRLACRFGACRHSISPHARLRPRVQRARLRPTRAGRMLSYLHAAPRPCRAGRVHRSRRRTRRARRCGGRAAHHARGPRSSSPFPGGKQYHQPGCPLVRNAGSKVQVMKQSRPSGAASRHTTAAIPASQTGCRGRGERQPRVRAAQRQAVSHLGLQAPEGGRDGHEGREGRAGPLALPRVQAADPQAREVAARSASPGPRAHRRCSVGRARRPAAPCLTILPCRYIL